MDVHVLDRGRIQADLNYALDAAVAGTVSDPTPSVEYAEFPVWNLVVEHPAATVLWDTGSHPDAADGHWPSPLYEAFAHPDAAERDLETALADVGLGIADIDVVVQSHLHVDHAGGLEHFAGTDVPVYVHRRELEHAYLSANSAAGGDAYLAADFDHDLAWRVVEGSRRLLREGFELVHLPGHTPGTLGALLERGTAGQDREGDGAGGAGDPADLLVVGDLAFLAENYRAGRSMGASLLTDSATWRESLAVARDLERRHDARVLFGHDPEQFERIRDGL